MYFLSLITLFIAGLGVFTYICLPKGRHRIISTVLFLGLAGGAFGIAFESIGTPKPIAVEWRDMKDLVVIGFLPEQTEKKVYVWVLRNGVPHSYVFPWPSDEQVQKAQDLWRKSRDTGDDFLLTGTDDEIARVRRERSLPLKQVRE